mmetsp:Transcript_77247/g.121564  ORF Transcript_77247/g.121564 Transcript_77247/m.121564 type:complete len:347 (-) Transcript_77247:55-1095(-)
MPFVAQVCSELPSGCRTPTPPILVSGYPYAESTDSQDGTKTPTDTGVFAFDSLQDKLQTLEAQAAKPNDFKFVDPLYVIPQAESAAKVKSQLVQLSSFAGPLPFAGFDKVVQEEAFAPPPAPHPVPRPITAATNPSGHIISLGSVGHPFNCAEACKYVKRKGGCRDGANCTKCHECFWSRIPAGGADVEQKLPEPQLPVEAQPFSVGSAGHPYTCSNPCKYVWRKQGCRDGADCPNCHYCKWQRRPKDEVSTPNPPPVVASQVSQSLEAMAIPPPPGLTPMEPEETHTTQESIDLLSSVGSLGHPYSCGLACKYVGKAKGCKDGTLCPNCHLCRWSRYANLKVFHL